MTKTTRYLLRFSLIIISFAISSQACILPVFRFALEQWQPDPWHMVIFFQDSLLPPQKAVLDSLDESFKPPRLPNLAVSGVNMTGCTDTAAIQHWKDAGSPPLPWVSVGTVRARPARGKPGFAEIWSGSLNLDSLKLLGHSPARTHIAARIDSGESAVWVLVKSGNTAEDQRARALLDSSLVTSAAALKLPIITDENRPEWYDPSVGPVLRIHFSVLEIAADDPAETMLRRMLRLLIADTAAVAGKPFAVPVFGRGRALEAFYGDRLSSGVIHQTCTFMSGSCSCEVKDLNPGMDLMIAADWEGPLRKPNGTGTKAVPRLQGMSALTDSSTVALQSKPQPAASIPVRRSDTARPAAAKQTGLFNAKPDTTPDVKPSSPLNAIALSPAPKDTATPAPAAVEKPRPAGIARNLVIAAAMVLLLAIIGTMVMLRRKQ